MRLPGLWLAGVSGSRSPYGVSARLFALVLVLAGVWLAGVASAGSSTAISWAGHWSIVDHGTAGVASGNDYPWSVTLVDQGGTLTSAGTPTPYDVHGSASGSSAHFEATSGGYHATFTLTLLAAGTTFTGTWTDNEGNAGTAKGTRAGKPPTTTSTTTTTTTSPQLPAVPPSDKPTGRMLAISPVGGVVTVKRGGMLYAASKNSQLQTGDIITTDKNTIVSIEFAIGGRVSINKDVSVQMINDRAVGDYGLTIKSIKRLAAATNIALFLDAATQDHHGSLEITTNGGAIGIKG